MARKTLEEACFEKLQHLLITLRLPPGKLTTEAELMDLSGFTRSPVRGAVSRLAKTGLLQTLPQKGILVTPLSLNDFLNISEFRIVVETWCAKVSAQRISDSAISELENLFDHATELIEANELDRYVEVDLRFHKKLAASTDNKYLMETLAQLFSLSVRFWYISFRRAGRLKETLQEHMDIIECLKMHDPEAAARAMEHHLIQSRQKILRVTWDFDVALTAVAANQPRP